MNENGSGPKRAELSNKLQAQKLASKYFWIALAVIVLAFLAIILFAIWLAAEVHLAIEIPAIVTIVMTAIIYLVNGSKIVPTNEEWIIEFRQGGAKDGLYYQTWQQGYHFLLPWLMRASAKVSLKERVLNLFEKKEEIELADGEKVQLTAKATVKATDSYKLRYAVEEGVPKVLELSVSAIQDAIDTHLRTLEIDAATALTGTQLVDTVAAKKDFIEDFQRWGLELVGMVVSDVEPSEEAQKRLDEIADIKHKKRLAEANKEIQELQGKADAAEERAKFWEHAKFLAGVADAEDDDLTAADKERIKRCILSAQDYFLEVERIKALKTTDKVITDSDSVGLTPRIIREEVQAELGQSRTSQRSSQAPSEDENL